MPSTPSTPFVRSVASVAAGLLVGCAPTAVPVDVPTPEAPVPAADPASAVPGSPGLTDVRWRLIGMVRRGEGVALPPGERLTLTLRADGSYTGEAGCNAFGGSVGAASGTPTLGEARSTRMACPEPSAAPALLAALGGARVEAVRGGTMTLVNAAGDRLTFENGLDAWDEAREAGVALRAVGQEPGWTLDVVPGQRIVFVSAYGERRAETPAPDATVVDGQTVYHATTESADLRVVVAPGPCADAMSGVRYPLTVTVTLDGETVSGCGRSLE